jgi:BlaI family transcriptional regulator, penicillinase repressor
MTVTFTERELDIMAVLWQHGASTAGEVREWLDDELAYNTVLTMLTILEEKGYVGHVEEGRTYRFHALVERKTAGASAIRRVVDKVFGGSEELLLSHLVRNQKLSRRTLQRLRTLLDDRLGEDR